MKTHQSSECHCQCERSFPYIMRHALNSWGSGHGFAGGKESNYHTKTLQTTATASSTFIIPEYMKIFFITSYFTGRPILRVSALETSKLFVMSPIVLISLTLKIRLFYI